METTTRQFPVSAEQLSWLRAEIRRARRSEGDRSLPEIRRFLTEIADHPEYMAHLNGGQFECDDDGRPIPFHVPPSVVSRHTRAFRQLSHPMCAVVSENRKLNVVIRRHFDGLALTDPLWAPTSLRVYSYADESRDICDYVVAHGYEKEFEHLLDPACGAGFHSLALRLRRSFSLDTSVRAIAYATLNAELNEADGCIAGINDIRDGLPAQVPSGRNLLVLVNMSVEIAPLLAAAPAQRMLSETYVAPSLTESAISAIEALWRQSALKRLLAVVLFESPGRSERGPWAIEYAAKKLAPSARSYAFVLTEKLMSRVNGRHASVNPMPLSGLELRASCRLTWREQEAPRVQAGYKALTEELKRQEWSHLGYGILEMEFTR